MHGSRRPYSDELPFPSAIEVADAVRNRIITARDAVEFSLERIARQNDQLTAFVHVDEHPAREAAWRIDRRIADGEDIGLLCGVPFAVKDFTNCRGMPTTRGSRAFRNNPLPTEDDPLIARLRAADAIPIGKTNVPEFGMHSATYNEVFGVTRNPWNPARTPGGSSGGSSAAVAAGMTPFATGTDGGGSIRTPAAFCGLVGLKTTHALLPRASGTSPLSCPGFLTSTVADTARLLDIAAGAHLADKMSLTKPPYSFETLIETHDVAGLRVAWSPDLGYAPVEPEIENCAFEAFQKLAAVAQLSVVNHDLRLTNVYRHWVLRNLNFLADELRVDGISLDDLDRRTVDMLTRFSRSDPHVHIEIDRAFAELEQETAALFSKIDVLVTPSTACAPFAAHAEVPDRICGQDATWTGAEPLSMFANVAWLPAVSVPAGFTSDGLPIGVQIVARRHEDYVLLRLARLLERHAPWPRVASPAQSEKIDQQSIF